ncbi:MAG: serine protein kinase RIO [Propionibacteriaceae bacterium]
MGTTPSVHPDAHARTEPFTWAEVPELDPDQRWSTWDDIGILAGPDPLPDWVVTEDAAIDTELGILKTGKEAEVFLLERATADKSSVLAAKRYRAPEHRQFHRNALYTEDRGMRNSRDRRALARNSTYGKKVQASAWAASEFDRLSQFWSAGISVPYPLQLDGEEILMEFVGLPDGAAAPRLAQARPDPDLLPVLWEQLRESMIRIAGLGLAHADLSAYNVLLADERVVIIDLPQAVDLLTNPQGMEFLARDCRNVCSWFTSRRFPVDPDELLAELVAAAW